jgi:hypothetical protein
MVHTLAAHKPHSASDLVSHDAPAVHFLFVDPTRTVKGLDERGLEGTDFEGTNASHRGLFCQVRQRSSAAMGSSYAVPDRSGLAMR